MKRAHPTEGGRHQYLYRLPDGREVWLDDATHGVRRVSHQLADGSYAVATLVGSTTVITVRLDAAEDAALDALAERQGVTRSEAVRRAIAAASP